jgi:hypothetical protein
MLMLTLTLMLVWGWVLVLMLVTAPVVEGRVVNRPPIGNVRTPALPVKHEVIVEVVKTVVVPGVDRCGVMVAVEADPEVVEATAGAGVDVAGLPPPPSPRPSPPVTPRSTPNVAESPRLRPDEPALRPSPRPASAESDTPRVAETLALRIGLPDGPRTTPPLTPAPAEIVAGTVMQPLRMLPPFEQVVTGMPPDVVRVTSPDGNEADNDGMSVVAGSVEGSVTPGRSEDSADETPSAMGPAT